MPSFAISRQTHLSNPSTAKHPLKDLHVRIQPKQYVQGGSRDSGQNSNGIALAAGALGIGVLVVGLFALRGTSQPASGVRLSLGIWRAGHI